MIAKNEIVIHILMYMHSSVIARGDHNPTTRKNGRSQTIFLLLATLLRAPVL